MLGYNVLLSWRLYSFWHSSRSHAQNPTYGESQAAEVAFLSQDYAEPSAVMVDRAIDSEVHVETTA